MANSTWKIPDHFDFEPDLNSGCWLWNGKLNAGGYGMVHFLGKPWGVHRWMLWSFTGILPKGARALHSCHTPTCCNPAHLRWGTAKENTKDMIAARRGYWQRPKLSRDELFLKLGLTP